MIATALKWFGQRLFLNDKRRIATPTLKASEPSIKQSEREQGMTVSPIYDR